MKCQPCSTVRQYYPSDPWLHKFYSTGCVHCGARRIQVIQRKELLPAGEKRDRCRQTLSLWMKYGHGESELRELAKQKEWAIEAK